MLGKCVCELGRPSSTRIIRSERPDKPNGETGCSGEGVGGGHSTEDGLDNTTGPEGRSPALSMLRMEVRASECPKG